MSYAVTLVPGDVTGRAVTDAVKRMVAATGVTIDWEEVPSGAVSDELIESALRTGMVLMDYQRGDRDRGGLAPIVELRKALQAFANVRPVQSVRGLPTRFDDVDIVIVRETTEDVYAHLEHESIPGTFESLKVTTQAACERIARHAFDYAREHGRKKVTVVHKANIMKKSDGLFLRTAREVAADYPDIEVEDRIVDALCMQLILYPERFDVLLAGNLFGDIVADLACGLVGGPANCPSITVAPGVRVFSAPQDHSGDGGGNPLAVAWPAVILLRHLGEVPAADALMRALEDHAGGRGRPVRERRGVCGCGGGQAGRCRTLRGSLACGGNGISGSVRRGQALVPRRSS